VIVTIFVMSQAPFTPSAPPRVVSTTWRTRACLCRSVAQCPRSRRAGSADRYLPVRSRCAHPGQQQGRRWPSSSSSWVRRIRRSRVVGCLASSTQQMNSLRAKGVMSFQASHAVGFATSALRRSLGSLCTTPPGTRELLTGPRERGEDTPWHPASWLAAILMELADTHLTPAVGRCVRPRQPGIGIPNVDSAESECLAGTRNMPER